MLIRRLGKFASYKDSKDFAVYLDANGSEDLGEVSGVVEGNAPIEDRLGGVVRAFRQYHAERWTNTDLTPSKYKYITDLDSLDIDYVSGRYVGVLFFDDPWVGDFELHKVDGSPVALSGRALVIYYS